MARPLKPFIRGGGYYPSSRWTPLVYPGGYTTANGGGQPEPEAVLKTVTGSLIHITDALALPAEALTVNVEPIQAGSGDPSPDNVRPISGRTSATVTRTGKNIVNKADGKNTVSNWFIGSDGTNTGADGSFMLNAGTYTFSVSDTASGMYVTNSSNVNIKIAYNTTQLTFSIAERMPIKLKIYKNGSTTEYWNSINIQLELGSTASAYKPYHGDTYTIQLGDTVYGGTLDVTGGKMVVTHMLFSRNSATMDNSEAYPGWRDSGLKSLGFTSQSLRNVIGNIGTNCGVNTSGSRDILYLSQRDYGGKTQSDFKALAIDVQFVLPLPTPIEVTLTPTQIDMLLGENNLWSDAGDSTLTYYAEGEASTSEALGILLGGTYNNPGGADDASDDEALGILLGGS